MAKKKLNTKKKAGLDPKKTLAYMQERYGTQTQWADVEVYLTAAEVESCFGPRCEEYEPYCACCQAWFQWQKTGKVRVNITRDEALKLLEIKVDG